MQLEPCPACQRHVRTDERVCPFCAAEIATTMARAPKRTLPGQRLGRAALMTFSLSAGAAALTGCDDDGTTPETDAGTTAAEDARVPDAGAPDAASDASTADASSIDASDSGEPHVVPLYGAVAQPLVAPEPRDAGADAATDAGKLVGPPHHPVPLYGAPPIPLTGEPAVTTKP